MKRSLLSLAVFAFGVACDRTSEPDSTFAVIESQILQTSCAQGCHVTGSSFATQSGLVLESGKAYAALANKTPKNVAAAADGLVLVSTAGVSGLDKSFLWKKIDTEHDHAGEHPNYGQLMPLGRDPLTNGQLEFIRQWIVAGAPETGVVANESLLADTTVHREHKVFRPLSPPARGVQIKLGPFDVAANFEREFNYFQPNTSTETRYIKRVEISMRPGSHHFILYSFASSLPKSQYPAPFVYRDIRNLNGSFNFENLAVMAHHDFFAGTQWPELDDSLPDGVALEWPAGMGFDLNSHYVNRGSTTLQGEVHVNLHTIDRSEFTHVAKVLNITNTRFSLPAGQTTKIEYTRMATELMNIIKMYSHAHQLMTRFDIQLVGGSRNGEIVYSTTDWEHPPILTLSPPLVLQAGEGLKLITTYTNWRNRTVNFGLTSEDEMMILFGYWY